MRPDESILLAVLGVLVAAVSASMMVVAIVAAKVVRRRLETVTARSPGPAERVRSSLRDARQTLARSAEAMDRIRQASDGVDARLAAWTAGLADIRGSIERTGRDRLERVSGVLAAAASLARLIVLWRP